MIREAQRSELPAILELWLESTTWGHPFIKANYWRECIPLVRAVRRGIGKALMQYVQQRYPHLMLEVYQKNQPAIDFYQAQGFHIVDCAWQDETQLPTWIMSWPVVQTL